MLEVSNLHKDFIKNINKNKTITYKALDNINITCKEGHIIGILGPNGAGKTTLLRILAGIMKPTKGNITIDNLTYDENSTEIKKKIANLSGNTKIYQSFSPYELLKMCAMFYDIPKNKIDNKIKEVSKILIMDDFLYNRISRLSTGQTQRVNIARCLIHNPKYYIFDEVTNGLDVITSQIILDFIKKEKENNKTILYSTHYMEEAQNICDYVYMLNKGKILIHGTPLEIMNKTKTNNLRDAFFVLIKGENYE